MDYIYEIIAATDWMPECIRRTDKQGNEAVVPNDPANSDYQAYLKYLEENK